MRPRLENPSIYRWGGVLMGHNQSSLLRCRENPMPDYYKVLGVSPQAQEDEIRRAYRKLAMKWHPDRNPDPEAAERFKEITDAYQVLCDPIRRASYDRSRQGAFPKDAFFSSLFESVLFDSFFDGMSWAGPRQRARRGENLMADVEISLGESWRGCHIDLTYQRIQWCSSCNGSGHKPGHPPARCPQCAGRGVVSGGMLGPVACSCCAGYGNVITAPCDVCGGRGRRATEVQIPLNIPAGVNDGDRLVLAGLGNSGIAGGSDGDLVITVHVKPMDGFRRVGHELWTQVRINIAQAALGCSVQVPTIDGETVLTIPPGVQSGDLLRLKGLGFPMDNGDRADQVVDVRVDVPAKLTSKQRRLLEKLKKSFEE
jgi:molecular chaperone DnaJ